MSTINRKTQAAMIGKVGSSTSVVATIHYLTNDSERVDWTRTQHLASSEKDFVIDQMQATAAMSRTDQPIYHYSISWDEADNPTRRQMVAAAEQTLDDLGLGDHQALIVAHSDHDYKHLHVMANRVHPETGRAWNRHRDYEKLERSLRPIERDQGWTEVPGHHLQLEGQKKPEYGRSLNRKEAARVKDGKLPFFAQVRQLAEGDFRQAETWRDLHDRMAEHGLTIQRGDRGTGGKVTDGHSYCNLSKIHRDFSMNKLSERLGPFKSIGQMRGRSALTTKQKTFLRFERSVRLDKPRQHADRSRVHQMMKALGSANQVRKTLGRLAETTTPGNPAYQITKTIGKKIINELRKQQQQTNERGRSL